MWITRNLTHATTIFISVNLIKFIVILKNNRTRYIDYLKQKKRIEIIHTLFKILFIRPNIDLYSTLLMYMPLPTQFQPLSVLRIILDFQCPG